MNLLTTRAPPLASTRQGWFFSQGGFTLIELMVVVVIVGILAAIALPAYQKQVAKGRRADAVTALSGILQAQERRRSNNGSYTKDLNDLNQSDRSAANHYSLSIDGLGTGTTRSLAAGFIAYARPVATGLQATDTDCAEMSISVQRGNVVYAALNSASADSTKICWPK